MAARAQFAVQHLSTVPRGWHVRTKREGTHEIRLAFPPGRRRRGAGKVVEILHPKTNPACEKGKCSIASNPELLLIFGNPTRPKGATDKVRGMLASYRTMRRGGVAKERAIKQALAGSFATSEEKKLFLRATRRANAGTAGHKPGCPCFACKHRRGKGGQSSRRVRRPRRNPAAGDFGGAAETQRAVKVFETFHGKQPQEILDVQRSDAMRSNYAAAGDLVALGLGNENHLHGDRLAQTWEKQADFISFRGDGVKLATSTNGRQLYLIGGRQNLDSALGYWQGIDPTKDLIDLGEAYFVVYDARKRHANFQPVEYTHEFGEKGGVRPRIVYDRLKKEIALVGGEYFIDLDQPLSPGIEN